MNKAPIVLAIMAATGTACAAAATPSMNFLSVAAVPVQGAAQSSVAQTRHADQMVVVVKEPAACGRRLSQPSAAIRDGMLQLGYVRPEVATGCLATGIFTIKGLPRDALQVVARAQAPVQQPVDSIASASLPMEFHAVTAHPVLGPVQRAITQERKDDRIVAVVSEPAGCGARIADPWVSLQGAHLALHYTVTGSTPSRATCAATAVFAVNGLPQRELTAIGPIQPGLVFAGGDQAAAPTMHFLASPATKAAGFSGKREVAQMRNGDAMTLVVREPASCGVRAQAASYQLEGSQLTVHYQLSGSRDASANCVSTAMITFRGLPERELQVAASSDPTPGTSVGALALGM